MKNYIFDIDGTISEAGQPISRKIDNSLTHLLEQGNSVVFASARPVRDMLPMVSETLRNRALFIGCNGGMALKNGEMLHCEKLDKSYVFSTINTLQKLNIPYVLDGSWGFSTSLQKHEFHDYIKSLSSHEETEEQLLSNGVTKILVLSDANNIKELISKFDNEQISIHIHSSEHFFDLTVKGNNKYNTIMQFIDGEYMAFGNDKNDFLMLDHATVSVFVGAEAEYHHADIYLKFNEVADFIQKQFD